MKPMVEVLKNGMKLVMRPSIAAPVVAYQVWVGVGSADEAKGEEGLAHVLEHMLFKGTKRRAVGEITRDVERAGGQINAWTSYDETVYYITLASRYQDQGLDILADAVQHATLDAAELTRELMVIREEIRMGEDEPDQVLVQNLLGTIFKCHPYGRPIIGFDRTVRAFTREKVADFYRRWYCPENMVLSVAGDFDVPEMSGKVVRAFSHFRAVGEPVKRLRREEPEQRRARFSSAIRPISEVHIGVAFPIPGIKHEDVAALDLVAGILGQGMSARLERKVRRELGLVSDIRAMAYTPRDMGVFTVLAVCQPHQLERAQAAIMAELQEITERPVLGAELKKAQTMIESESIYSEETVDGLARKSAFYLLHADDIDFERRYLAAIAGTGVEDIAETASRYLIGTRASVAVVLPDPARRTPKRKVAWVTGKGADRKVDTKVLGARLLGFAEKTGCGTSAGGKVRAALPATTARLLSSGDLLLLRPDPASRIVAARAAFLGGLRSEPEKQAGLSMLLANTLIRGTTQASSAEVATMMDALACSISGFSGRNTIGIHGEFLSSNFPDGFALMAACLRHPAFPDKEVEREKALLIEDIREAEDNPSKQAFRRFYKAMFGDHPYGRHTLGSEETVNGLDRKALARGLAIATEPGRMVLSVVGGFDVDEVVALSESLMTSNAKKGHAVRELKSWLPSAHPTQTTYDLPKEQSHVVVGFPGTTLTADDRFAVEVLTEILGGHGGRLFEQVREVEGLAYSVTALSMEGIDPGCLMLYAGTSPGKEVAVTTAMVKEAKRISTTRPSRDELGRVKHHLIGTRAISWQRAATRAANMALDELYGNGHDAADSYAAHIDAVTASDIVSTARRYLDLSRRIVVCVGPDANRLRLV